MSLRTARRDASQSFLLSFWVRNFGHENAAGRQLLKALLRFTADFLKIAANLFTRFYFDVNVASVAINYLIGSFRSKSQRQTACRIRRLFAA